MPFLPIKFFFQKTKNTLWHRPKSILANIVNGYPSKKLTIIGVTGTDGKTTTATLIYHTLRNAGIKTGLITTLGAKIGDKEVKTGLHTTSPDAFTVQKILQLAIKQGLTHMVIEVTAHALDQHRFYGCNFSVSLITNTSHEHLDYFPDMESYVKAKSKLFSMSRHAILNKDDSSYEPIKKTLTIPSTTFSINKPSDFKADEVRFSRGILSFKVGSLSFKTDSVYKYQTYNILAALAVISKLNIDTKNLISLVKKFPIVKGRREEVDNDLDFRTIIDFAHTPAALEGTLSSLKKLSKNNLIVIFGATGGRDKTKRPYMGKIVSQFANIALITSDDTRQEDISKINKDIISGIDSKKSQFIDYRQIISEKQIKKVSLSAHNQFTYLDIPNRQDAFNLAVKLAQKNDIIVACGKGHETTILHGKTEYPWSEAEAFRTAFRQKTLTND